MKMRQFQELIVQLPQVCNMAIVNPKGSQCVCCARDEASDYLHISIVAIPSVDILHEGHSAKLQTAVGYRCLGKSGRAPKSEINKGAYWPAQAATILYVCIRVDVRIRWCV